MPVGRVHVVVDDEDAQSRGAAPSRRLAGAQSAAGRGGSAAGSRTTNSLPLPGPSLVGGDGAAVQLGERPDQRQADAQAPLRAGERAVGLGEQVEHPRAAARARCRPRCPGPGDDLVPLRSRR